MAQAKSGDTVRVHYTGKTDDGNVFDKSTEDAPLEFTIGEGKIIPNFEQAIIGMEPGDSKTVRIESENAYGPHRPEMVMVIERKEVPSDLDPKVNQRLQVKHADGKTFAVTVTDVSEDNITLDANHPLAGQNLTFDIQLAEIA